MKNWTILPFVFVLLLNIKCSVSQKPSNGNGILQGSVGEFTGNCMPAPGMDPCKPNPLSTTVYITEPAQEFNIEFLLDSVVSAEDGSYQLEITAGSYSLFLRNKDEVVCTIIECPKLCYCSPFKVSADSTTVLNVNLDNATW